MHVTSKNICENYAVNESFQILLNIYKIYYRLERVDFQLYFNYREEILKNEEQFQIRNLFVQSLLSFKLNVI